MSFSVMQYLTLLVLINNICADLLVNVSAVTVSLIPNSLCYSLMKLMSCIVFKFENEEFLYSGPLGWVG